MTDVVIPVLACGHDAKAIDPMNPDYAYCPKWCGWQEVTGRRLIAG